MPKERPEGSTSVALTEQDCDKIKMMWSWGYVATLITTFSKCSPTKFGKSLKPTISTTPPTAASAASSYGSSGL